MTPEEQQAEILAILSQITPPGSDAQTAAADEIAATVLRAYFGAPGGFKDMEASDERRRASQAILALVRKAKP